MNDPFPSTFYASRKLALSSANRNLLEDAAMHDPLIASVIGKNGRRPAGQMSDPLEAPEWDGLLWMIELAAAWRRWRDARQ